MVYAPRTGFDRLFANKIVIYGAGVTGVETLKILSNYMHGIRVHCFCDSSKEGSLCNIPIISPSILKEMDRDDDLVVIAAGVSSNQQSIIDSIGALSLKRAYVYTVSDMEAIFEYNIKDERMDDWFRRVVEQKRLLRRGVLTDLYLSWWCPEHFTEGDILVYQPGKVGSTTVCNSLYASGVSATHVHMLTDSFVSDLLPELPWSPSESEAGALQKTSELCVEKIKRASRIKIITLVREPISRDFSQLVYHLPELQKLGYLNEQDPLSRTYTSGMYRRATLNRKCPDGYQFEWFNKELKAVFGIDVYAHEFDRRKGYSIIRQDDVEVLIIKLEKISLLTDIIADFCGIKSINLINSNVGLKKRNREFYSHLRERIGISNDVISLYYGDNALFNHFYDEEERSELLRTWEKNAI